MADTRPSPNPSPEHDCPGGCGSKVPHHKLSCRSCWFHLPIELRSAVINAPRGERLAAVGEAARWLREHLVNGRLPAQPGEATWSLDESWRPRNA